jgi:hypothetical protein
MSFLLDNKKIELNNMTDINSNITCIIEEMDLTKLTKTELLEKCEELGIKKCKSKNKGELIDLINVKSQPKKKVELIIEDDDTEEKINVNINKNLMDVSKEDDKISNTIITNKSNQIKHLKPLIKWSGGKSDEIKMFEKHFPEQFNKYIEPFVGGGSVYFYLNPNNAVISDVHIELIDLYKSISEGKMNDIYNFMKNTPNNEETYYKVRDEMEINEPLDNAKRFYYQRKTSFRGMLRYNTSLAVTEYYNGTSWINATTGKSLTLIPSSEINCSCTLSILSTKLSIFIILINKNKTPPLDVVYNLLRYS